MEGSNTATSRPACQLKKKKEDVCVLTQDCGLHLSAPEWHHSTFDQEGFLTQELILVSDAPTLYCILHWSAECFKGVWRPKWRFHCVICMDLMMGEKEASPLVHQQQVEVSIRIFKPASGRSGKIGFVRFDFLAHWQVLHPWPVDIHKWRPESNYPVTQWATEKKTSSLVVSHWSY